jgi:hypothetical protein
MAAVSCADDLSLQPQASWVAPHLGDSHGAACCPVRPDQFGFYATQWRPWPGFVPVAAPSSADRLTPSTPPRSVVPDVDREGDHAPRPRPAVQEQDAE